MRTGRDQGYAAVVLMVLMMLAVFLCGAVAFVGGIAAGRVRATTAADLAALAAAQDTDCGKARDVAASNGAELTMCRVEGLDVIVDVRVPVRLPGQQTFVTALSRAGPP